jgi:hypothetical protein
MPVEPGEFFTATRGGLRCGSARDAGQVAIPGFLSDCMAHRPCDDAPGTVVWIRSGQTVPNTSGSGDDIEIPVVGDIG